MTIDGRTSNEDCIFSYRNINCLFEWSDANKRYFKEMPPVRGECKSWKTASGCQEQPAPHVLHSVMMGARRANVILVWVKNRNRVMSLPLAASLRKRKDKQLHLTL